MILEKAIIYSLTVWFFFYLWNHADITEKARKFVYARIPEFLVYLLNCSFCSSFWLTLILAAIQVNLPFIGALNWIFIFVAPVINLFVELGYRNLRKAC